MFDTILFDLATFSGRVDERDVIPGDVPRWFSSAINQDPGSHLHDFMRVVFYMASKVSQIHRDIYEAGYLSSATGAALDALADEWEIYRTPGEDDEHFKLRIASERRIADSTGTAAEIRQAVADTLAMSTDDILVLERYQMYPLACFTVRLLNNPGVLADWADIDDLILLIKAAGTFYESPGYTITPEWVAGSAGFGYSGWGSDWGH